MSSRRRYSSAGACLGVGSGPGSLGPGGGGGRILLGGAGGGFSGALAFFGAAGRSSAGGAIRPGDAFLGGTRSRSIPERSSSSLPPIPRKREGTTTFGGLMMVIVTRFSAAPKGA